MQVDFIHDFDVVSPAASGSSIKDGGSATQAGLCFNIDRHGRGVNETILNNRRERDDIAQRETFVAQMLVRGPQSELQPFQDGLAGSTDADIGKPRTGRS